MPVEISEASAADAEEVSALAIKTYVDTFGAEFEPDELAHHLDLTISAARWREHFARDRVLVARLGGRAIGYVHFGPAGEAGDVAIHRLYVTAELQGQRIGTQLLSRALAEPEVAAAPAVRIDVWEHNHGARRLYERFGFRHEGGMEPFVLKSGEIDGYDVVLIRRPPPALALSDAGAPSARSPQSMTTPVLAIPTASSSSCVIAAGLARARALSRWGPVPASPRVRSWRRA